MKSKAPSLFLAGALVLGMAAVGMAGATPDAGRPGDEKAEHRGRRGPGLSAVATQHAQELGLSAQTVTRMKALEDAARPELEQLHAAIRARHEKLRNDTNALLTEQQRTKLRELARQQHGRGHRGFGGRGRRFDGQPPAAEVKPAI